MAEVEEIDERVSFLSNEERFSLIILGRTAGNKHTLRTLWLIAWLIIGGAVMWELDRHGDDKDLRLMLFVFMAFWAYYLYLIIRAVRWYQVGKEVLLIKDGQLTHKNAFGSIGKAFHYDLSNVGPMVKKEKSQGFAMLFEDSFWSTGSGRIALPARGRKLLVGKGLSDKSCNKVISIFNKELRKRLKEHR